MEVKVNIKCTTSLNRTILECKYVQVLPHVHSQASLNRTILECKFGTALSGGTNGTGLNRTILECKFQSITASIQVIEFKSNHIGM